MVCDIPGYEEKIKKLMKLLEEQKDNYSYSQILKWFNYQKFLNTDWNNFERLLEYVKKEIPIVFLIEYKGYFLEDDPWSSTHNNVDNVLLNNLGDPDLWTPKLTGDWKIVTE